MAWGLGRHFLSAWLAALALVAGSSPGQAQDAALQTAEPRRFALVIGNAEYAEKGNLPTLGSPCSDDPNAPGDADTFAAALRAADWTDVERACNLTTSELRTKLLQFIDKVTREERAFGLLYFSGHGAQVAGRNYIFGVDAFVDDEAEVRKYRQNRDAPLFTTSGVELDYEFSRLKHLWAKGVVVVIDACRNNPLLERLRNAGISSIRHPATSGEDRGIVFSFATRSGTTAPDGGPQGISRYAQALSEAIRTDGVRGEVDIENLLSEVHTKIVRQTHGDQIPGKAGELFRPPRFCIKGCPSLIEHWNHYNDVFREAAVAAPNYHDAFAGMRGASTRAGMPGRSFAANLARNAFPAKVPMTFATGTMLQAATGSAARPAQFEDTGPTAPRRMTRFDVFWCAGDKLANARRAKARELADLIGRYRGSNSPVPGFEAGEVGLRELPPAINARREYRLSKTAIHYDEDNPHEQIWANSIRSGVSWPIRPVARKRASPDYVSIFVCENYKVALPTKVYVQVARADQLEPARAFRDRFQSEEGRLAFEREIDVARDSPPKTEVRYFLRGQKDQARHLAAAVTRHFGGEAEIRLVRGYERYVARLRILELSFGSDETLMEGKAP